MAIHVYGIPPDFWTLFLLRDSRHGKSFEEKKISVSINTQSRSVSVRQLCLYPTREKAIDSTDYC